MFEKKMFIYFSQLSQHNERGNYFWQKWIVDRVAGENALKCSRRMKTFLALRSLKWFFSCTVVYCVL